MLENVGKSECKNVLKFTGKEVYIWQVTNRIITDRTILIAWLKCPTNK